MRARVWGVWHPKVDINAVHFDDEALPGLSVGGTEADVRKYVSDDIAGLIRSLEMCSHCLQEFPCSMHSSERFSRWAEVMDRGQFRIGGALTRRLVLDRVLERRCPMCGVPCSDSMSEQQIVDVRKK